MKNRPIGHLLEIGWENGHLLRHDRSLKLDSQRFSWACKEALFKIIKRAGEKVHERNDMTVLKSSR